MVHKHQMVQLKIQLKKLVQYLKLGMMKNKVLNVKLQHQQQYQGMDQHQVRQTLYQGISYIYYHQKKYGIVDMVMILQSQKQDNWIIIKTPKNHQNGQMVHVKCTVELVVLAGGYVLLVKLALLIILQLMRQAHIMVLMQTLLGAFLLLLESHKKL